MPSVSKKQAKLMAAITHGWHPPAGMKHAPSVKVATEFHEEDKREGKFEHATGYADGGSVDANKTQKGLDLISHAADRATAWLNSSAGHPPAPGEIADAHHLAARVAAGLGSQVLGLDDRGRPQLGKTPGIIKEAMAVPAGLVDIGDGLGSHIAGIKDVLAKLHAKYGSDLAPAWSRGAEGDADRTHQAVRAAMGLPPPRGASENFAEAGGAMLGQIPIGAEKAGEGFLAKLLKSPGEWVGPTVRPSVANYGIGTVAGGAMGDMADPPPQRVAQGLQ